MKWFATWIVTDKKQSKNKRQKKLRNAFNNNMSTDKAHTSKIIQSGGFLGPLLTKLAGPLMKVAIPLAKKRFSSISKLLMQEFKRK